MNSIRTHAEETRLFYIYIFISIKLVFNDNVLRKSFIIIKKN